MSQENNTQAASRISLDFSDDRLFTIALLLSLAPLWLTHYLPSVDLPGHAAQAVALGQLWRDNPVYEQLFVINWLTPYLSSTVLLAVLALIMPVNLAIKLIVSAIVVATPVLIGRVLKAFGGDPAWRWLAIPSVYSLALFWGFWPFLFSIPLGLILLLLTARFDRQPTWQMALGIAGFSLLLLVSHLLVLSFCSLLALAWLSGQHYRQPLRLILRCLPFAAPLPFIGLWMYSVSSGDSYMAADYMVFRPLSMRLHELVTQASGLDGKFKVISYLMFATLVALPLVSRLRLTRSPGKWLMVAAGSAVFFGFPSFAMGTALLYERFGLFMPLLWLLLWEPSPTANTRWHWVGMLIVSVCIVANMLRFAAFDVQARGFDAIVAQMPAGKRVASLSPQIRSNQFAAPVFMHFNSWYQAEQRGVVDFNFAMFDVTPVRYRAQTKPPFGDALAWSPFSFDWQRNGGNQYDYFLSRSPVDEGNAIFKADADKVEVVGNAGWWWLYRKLPEVN